VFAAMTEKGRWKWSGELKEDRRHDDEGWWDGRAPVWCICLVYCNCTTK